MIFAPLGLRGPSAKMSCAQQLIRWLVGRVELPLELEPEKLLVEPAGTIKMADALPNMVESGRSGHPASVFWAARGGVAQLVERRLCKP